MCTLLTAFVLLAGGIGGAAAAQEVARRVWAAPPPPADARPDPVRGVRVVDYGDDYIWHTGGDYFRGGPDQKGPESRGEVTNVDVDGDGNSEGDCIAYLTFSMDNPMNPPEPWWDSEGSNAIFYGGVTGFFADNAGKSGFSELMINVHETPDGDNLSVHTFGTRERHRNYHVFLWKKEDFLKGGDKRRVSTDDESLLVVHVMRCWVGMDGARFVLLEADPSNPSGPGRFYISEYDFGNEEAQQVFRDSTQGKVFSVCPMDTRWAEYNPKAPYDIVFERENAVYEEHQFRDIRAAGYYVAKHEWAAVSQGAKTYAFELYATVHRPERPSESLAMARVAPSASGEGILPFYISKCEIPYALWSKVRRPAVAQMYGNEEHYPYITDRDGDMGSMDYAPPDEGLKEHGAAEPVTDITWLDAVAWCNMLSEYEGREPCYYFTPSFDTVFRRVRERRMYQRDAWYVPKVYVKWDADGYRLPTDGEWLAAGGQWSVAGGQSAWIGENSGGATHPVGTREPNEFGLYDMAGNVWEYVWDVGESYQEEEEIGCRGEHVALGGDFNYPADPMTMSASPYGDEPHKGNYNIGFRVVRSTTGARPALAADVERNPSGTPPVWAFKAGDKSTGKTLERLPEGQTVLDVVQIPEADYVRWDTAKVYASPFHVAKREVSYGKWKQVYDWAVAKGYEFNKDGDMGSMDRETGRHVHSPDEPVTDINRFDAILWCNALSEMEGRKPCYYDGGGTAVTRRAHQYRRVWTHLPAKYKEPQFTPLDFDVMSRLDKLSNWHCSVDWSADGYRIPTMAEWIVACKAGTTTRWYWGDEFDVEGRYAWSAENSGGKTHPVGLLGPNAFGLHDMMGNVFEYCWGQDPGGKKQQFHETWNPKGEAEWRGELLHHVVRGGSFRYSSYWWRAFLPDGYGKTVRCFSLKGYPEIGFRPVRCEARTHRKSGSEMPEFIQVLDVNLKEAVTPLQGATHRANLQRTGVHYTASLRKRPEIKWAFQTGDAIWAQPVATRGRVYVFSEDGFICGLDDESGEELWRYKTAGGPVTDSKDWRKGSIRPPGPTIKDGILYIGDNAGYVYALDIRTGRPKWKTTVRGGQFAPGSPVPVYGAVFVYIGSYTEDGGLLALHGETGQVLNVYRNTFWGSWQSFAFAQGKLFMANHVAGSMLDLRSGERRSFGASSWHSGYNTPVVGDGRLYLVGQGFGAADFRSGMPIFYTPIEGDTLKSTESAEGRSENTLALWNDAAFFANQAGYAYAYDALTGKRLWRTGLGSRVRSAPSISTDSPEGQDAVVYVGCDDGRIWALDAVDGGKLWSLDTGASVKADPWISEGVLYVANSDGKLLALVDDSVAGMP